MERGGTSYLTSDGWEEKESQKLWWIFITASHDPRDPACFWKWSEDSPCTGRPSEITGRPSLGGALRPPWLGWPSGIISACTDKTRSQSVYDVYAHNGVIVLSSDRQDSSRAEMWGWGVGVGGRRQGKRRKDGRPRERQAHLSNCSINSFKGEGNDRESRKPQNTSRIAQSTLHKYPWGIMDMFSAAVFLPVSWIEALTRSLSSMNDEPLLLAWCVSHSAIILFGPS